MLNKTCRDCKQDLPLEEYSPNSRGKFQRAQACRPCSAKVAEAYRESNYYRVYANKFKTTEEEIKQILSRIVCDICQAEPKAHKRHSIDHCHTTGKIRGLLCDECNSGLGMFKDNVELLKLAKAYLNERS